MNEGEFTIEGGKEGEEGGEGDFTGKGGREKRRKRCYKEREVVGE